MHPISLGLMLLLYLLVFGVAFCLAGLFWSVFENDLRDIMQWLKRRR